MIESSDPSFPDWSPPASSLEDTSDRETWATTPPVSETWTVTVEESGIPGRWRYSVTHGRRGSVAGTSGTQSEAGEQAIRALTRLVRSGS